MIDEHVRGRAGRHAALGDPVRLAIVDELVVSDRAPTELRAMFDLPSNLLAHHLDVLEGVGLVTRHRSSGDGRRRYVHLELDGLDHLRPGQPITTGPALFVCTHNSARSQLAAALWEELAGAPAMSAGTHPADRVHPGATAAAKRRHLDISGRRPRHLDGLADVPALVVTVCDRAHEELESGAGWLHWSIPDPVTSGDRAAFDAARDELEQRITNILMTGRAA